MMNKKDKTTCGLTWVDGGPDSYATTYSESFTYCTCGATSCSPSAISVTHLKNNAKITPEAGLAFKSQCW